MSRAVKRTSMRSHQYSPLLFKTGNGCQAISGNAFRAFDFQAPPTRIFHESVIIQARYAKGQLYRGTANPEQDTGRRGLTNDESSKIGHICINMYNFASRRKFQPGPDRKIDKKLYPILQYADSGMGWQTRPSPCRRTAGGGE